MVTDRKISVKEKCYNAFKKRISINHTHTFKIILHKTEIWMHTKSFLSYISLFFVRSDIFCSYLKKIYILMLFLLSLLFPQSVHAYLRLLSQMLRLEFNVNQHGLKRHHWSTSFWYIYIYSPNKATVSSTSSSTEQPFVLVKWSNKMIKFILHKTNQPFEWMI